MLLLEREHGWVYMVYIQMDTIQLTFGHHLLLIEVRILQHTFGMDLDLLLDILTEHGRYEKTHEIIAVIMPLL